MEEEVIQEHQAPEEQPVEKPKRKRMATQEEQVGKRKPIRRPRTDFEEFWLMYGKMIDRKRCEAKWNRLNDEDVAAIKIHAPLYVASTPNKTYRKLPLTYLNGEVWKDEELPDGTSPVPISTMPAVDINALIDSKARKILGID